MPKTFNCANCKDTVILTAQFDIKMAEEFGCLCDDCQNTKNEFNAILDSYDRYEEYVA